ncbi:MAG: hypothetical protein QXM43_09455 [Desulfurococcaceae archaeon]
MPWRIEYAGHSWHGRKHKKILEDAIAEAIEEIKRLLRRKQDGAFCLEKQVLVSSQLGCTNLRDII